MDARNQSNDTQAVFEFPGPLLATRCIVTIRGYRVLSLRIHVGPFRLAARSSQVPAEGSGGFEVVPCHPFEAHEDVVFTCETASDLVATIPMVS